MTQGEVDTFLEDWRELVMKVFKYRREFMPTEYVTFKRQGDLFCPVEDDCTRKMEILDKGRFSTLLKNGEFVFYGDWHITTNVVEMKTGGCTCAGWALGDGTLHYHGCIVKRLFE